MTTTTNEKELSFEDLMFDDENVEHQQHKPSRTRRSSNTKFKKTQNQNFDQDKKKNSYHQHERTTFSSSFKNRKFSKSFSPKFGSIPLDSPRVEMEDGIIIEIENLNENKLKNQKEIFDKITSISTIVSVDKLNQSTSDAFLLTFNENLDELLEKIQNLKFDENNFKINSRKSKESKMIVLKNIPFKLKSDDLVDLIKKRDVEGLKNIKYQYKDNAFIGFAFASFNTEKEALDSIEKINGLNVMNRLITAEIKKNQRKESFSFNNHHISSLSNSYNNQSNSLPNQHISTPTIVTPEKKGNQSIKELKKTLERNKKGSPKKLDFSTKEDKKKKIVLIEGDEILIQIYEKIDEFIKEPSQKFISFPSDLESFYRKKIHSLAEQIEMNAYSQGKGIERFISLKKIESVDYSIFDISIVRTKAIQSPIPHKENIKIEPIVFSGKINPFNLSKIHLKEATVPDGTIGFQGLGRGKPMKNESK